MLPHKNISGDATLFSCNLPSWHSLNDGGASIAVSASLWLSLAIILTVPPLAICRLFVHPVYHIPGPCLAKITYGYRFYFDVLLGGVMAKQIMKLHDTYGPYSTIYYGTESLQVQSSESLQIGYTLNIPNFIKSMFCYSIHVFHVDSNPGFMDQRKSS